MNNQPNDIEIKWQIIFSVVGMQEIESNKINLLNSPLKISRKNHF